MSKATTLAQLELHALKSANYTDKKVAELGDNVIAAIEEQSNTTVRHDKAQALTEAQKAQARENIGAIDDTKLAEELARRGQLAPEYASSIEECTDTSKMYVLPDGYIYAYMSRVTPGGQPLFTNLADPSTANDSEPNTAVNADEWLNGYYLSTSGAPSVLSGNIVTNLIPLTHTDTIRITGFDDTTLNNKQYLRVVYLDSSGTVIQTSRKIAISKDVEGIGDLEEMDATELENGVYCFSPSTHRLASYLTNVAFIRVCGYLLYGNSGVIVTVNEPIAYSEEGTTEGWLNTGHAFVPADYEDRIIDLENRVDDLESDNAGSGGAMVSDDVDILVPSCDVAVVGREYNIYKNTVVFGRLSVENYDVDITINDTSTKAYNYNEVWRYTPTTAGTYTITIKVRDRKLGNNAVYATKTMTLYVVANAVVTGKKVLFIGDSLTYAGKYTAEIQHNLSNGGIVSVGTIERTVSINNTDLTAVCEGRNGWATWDYAGTWADSLTKFQSESNVFRNPDTNQFDLGYYMQTYHSGVTLNAVCLNLGTNGVGATTLNVAGMNEIISRIREYNATIPILIHIPIVEAPGEFYAYLGSRFTSPYMRMRWFELAEAFIKEYDGTMANVYVVPVYFNLDENNDFPKTEMAVSARNPATIKRITDGHPNTYGYLKMADVYYAHLLKYMV